MSYALLPIQLREPTAKIAAAFETAANAQHAKLDADHVEDGVRNDAENVLAYIDLAINVAVDLFAQEDSTVIVDFGVPNHAAVNGEFSVTLPLSINVSTPRRFVAPVEDEPTRIDIGVDGPEIGRAA